MELQFGLLSVVEKLMHLQDCGFNEMFVTISSMSALVMPLPSVSFHVHLQVVSTKNGLVHISHAESLSPVSSDHVSEGSKMPNLYFGKVFFQSACTGCPKKNVP